MAERVGFEPTVPRGTHAFQACLIGQTLAPLLVEILRLAERAGFEPAVPCGTPHFECGTLSQAPPPLQLAQALLPYRSIAGLSPVPTAHRNPEDTITDS